MTDTLRDEIALAIDQIRVEHAGYGETVVYADAILSLLTRAGWQHVGPEDVVVPREPTEAMLRAGFGPVSDLYERPTSTNIEIRTAGGACYRAMLAAARPTPTPAEGETR